MLKKTGGIKISTKIIFFFSILVLFQAIVSLFALSFVITRSNTDSQFSVMRSTLSSVDGYLNETTTDLIVKANLFAGQEKAIDYTDFGLRNLLNRELNLLKNTLRIDSVGIFVFPNKIFTSVGEKIKPSYNLEQQLKLAFKDNKNKFLLKNKNDIFLHAICPIKRGDRIIAVLLLSQKVDKLFILKLEKIINSRAVFIYNDILIHDESLPEDEIRTIITEYNRLSGTNGHVLRIKEYVIGVIDSTVFGTSGATIFCLLDTAKYRKQINSYYLISISSTIIILLIALITGFLFYRETFFKPIQILLEGIKRISSGSFNPPFRILRNDEVGKLSMAFNQMCKDLLYREKELVRLSKYNTLVLNNVESGIITVNKKNEIITINPCAERILNIDRKRIKKITSKRIPIDFSKILIESLSNDSYLSSMEVGIVKDQDNKIFDISISPLLSLDGKNIGIVAIFNDITRIKKLEEKLSISSRLAALGEMAAGVAHQIRNPLAVMKVSVEMLRDNYLPPQKYDDYLRLTNLVTDEIDALNMVVHNFLDFAHPKSGDMAFHPIEKIINFSLKSLPLEKYSGIKIEVDIQKGIPEYRMDKNLMIQVITNLVLNSLQASSRGSRVLVRAGIEKKKLVIEVQDWGVGMDDSTKKNIFNPFYTTKDSGTGLGLSIVHQIIERCNGVIDVFSSPGAGTIFRIVL